MRFLSSSHSILAGALLLGVSVAGAQETPVQKLERENRHLKLQLENLRKSLAESLIREESKTASLKRTKEHLALIGQDLYTTLDGGKKTKLLSAVTDYQIASENLTQLRSATGDLLPILKEYLRTAIASDPESRATVEAKIRELEVALGTRQQPKRKIEQGTAREARVVTVDSKTGAIVVNAGSDAELSVGMRFRIERSGTLIGDATVAATRPNVSGLLMQSLTNPDVSAKPGDIAKIILNPTN